MGANVYEPNHEKCSLLLLKAPDSLCVGLDYCSWKIQPKFVGIRNIVPGAHFFHWTPLDEGELSILGHFIFFEPRQVVVRRWCWKTDTFQELDDDESKRFEVGVRRGDFLLNMGIYPPEWIPRWKEVTYYITKDVIERIEPVHKFISASTKEYDMEDVRKEVRFQERLSQMFSTTNHEDSNSDTQTSLRNDEANIDHSNSRIKIKEDQDEHVSKNSLCVELNDASRHVYSDTLFFSEIPKLHIPPNSSGPIITILSHDHTNVLQDLVEKQFKGDWTQLLGEIQLAFVCFLLGQNYEAYESWKKLITLLSCCDKAVQLYPKLYVGFCRVIHNHLLQLPIDFFSDVLLANNFLVQCLGNLCEICDDPVVSPKLTLLIGYLKEAVEQKFNTSLEELLQLSENAPVVVDAQESLVSFDNKSSTVS